MVLLGATLPELISRLGLDMEQRGTLFSILYVAHILMAFLAGPFIDRYGKKPVLAGGALVCAASLVGGMVLPAAVGYVAKGATVRTGLWLLVGTAVLLVVVQALFIRYERQRFPSPEV